MNLAGPRLRAVLTSVVLSVVVAPRSARAETSASPPMSNEMRAEQLFRTGKKNYDAGKYAEACVNFQDSLRIAPKLGTLLNLALCHEAAGKLATAWSEFHYGAAWAAQNNQLDRRDFAIEHLRAIEVKLPRVALQFPAGTAIASVEVDGEPLAEQRWYLPLFLDPGEHVVTVNAPGKARGKVAFRVIGSPTEQIVVIPPLADDDGAPAPVGPGEPPPPGDGGRRTAGWVTLGASGVLFATGIGFGAVALSADDADVKSPATVSTIAFVGAGLAAGAGLWLLLGGKPARSTAVAVSPFGISGSF